MADPLAVDRRRLRATPTSASATTREQSRSRRKHPVMGRSIRVDRIPQRELQAARREYPAINHWRPKTRADCAQVPRPCPYVGCRWNLYLDTSRNCRSIKINFPDLEPWEMSESCTLDVAERGGLKNEDVGELMNLTRERVRQIEETGRAILSLHSYLKEHLTVTTDVTVLIWQRITCGYRVSEQSEIAGPVGGP